LNSGILESRVNGEIGLFLIWNMARTKEVKVKETLPFSEGKKKVSPKSKVVRGDHAKNLLLI
jgi:hypothetical protein